MNDKIAERASDRLVAEFRALCARPLEPALYLVATPIGNLGDMTLRGLSVLARADKVYCEDTRHSRKLTNHFGLDIKLSAYHDHNADRVRPHIMEDLGKGQSVALISDAGTPLISDPGFKLAREVLDAGLKVISLPGATAPIVALTSSGLPTDSFQFAGFLPSKQMARRAHIEAIRNADCAVIFFEAPSRLKAALDDLSQVLGERGAVVARELTKMHEEVRRGNLSELARWAGEANIKGEIVIIVAPGEAQELSEAEIIARLEHAMKPQSLKDAAREVADECGVAKKRVYELGLKHFDRK